MTAQHEQQPPAPAAAGTAGTAGTADTAGTRAVGRAAAPQATGTAGTAGVRPAAAPRTAKMAGTAAVRPAVVLVGPPGAGKTVVGKLVAQRLDLPFRDTDADVMDRAGKPIMDIFVDDGEDAFRALELAAVATALAEHTGVLSLGGGAVLSEHTRRLLAGYRVVFLAVDLPAATHRTGLNRDRPLLLGNPRAALRALLAARLPLYQQVATATVVTDELGPDEVADAVIRAVRGVRR